MHTLCITAADVTRPDMGNMMMNEAIPRMGLSARYQKFKSVGSASVCAKVAHCCPSLRLFARLSPFLCLLSCHAKHPELAKNCAKDAGTLLYSICDGLHMAKDM